MNTVLLVYKSNTGFTKTYAQWIQAELNCTSVELKDVNIFDVNKYDIVIFGGGMHANKINGIKFIKDNLEVFRNKHLIIFATGATPASAIEEVKRFERANIPAELQIPFFYFQSGMNYSDMKINDKLMMNCLKLALKIKKNRNPSEQGTMEAITNSYNNSNVIFIKPLIDHVRGLLIESEYSLEGRNFND